MPLEICIVILPRCFKRQASTPVFKQSILNVCCFIFLPRINVYLLSVDKGLRRWGIRNDAPEGDGNRLAFLKSLKPIPNKN